ncbi:MAG: L-rhamnose mutarotase [Edaphobacter sp.]
MQRHAHIVHLRPEAEAAYKKYHQTVWPDVLSKITDCNIRNYSIFLHDSILFSYFEYIGDDFATDMANMAADAKTQEWWAITKSMQRPLEDRGKGEWWASLAEVFHLD